MDRIGSMAAPGGSTVALVLRALDAAALRHRAIAHNIANVNSADYVPLEVRFDAQLAAARGDLGEPRLERQSGIAPGPRPQDLDGEMVKLSQNTLHYQALVRALGERLAILGDAIGEAKR